MEYIKPIYEVNTNNIEIESYIENNIEETQEFKQIVKNIENDIKSNLNNKTKLRKEVDNLSNQKLIYIKNKDLFFNKKYNILIPDTKVEDQGNGFQLEGFNERVMTIDEFEFFKTNKIFRQKIISKYLNKMNIKLAYDLYDVPDEFINYSNEFNLKNYEKIILLLVNIIIPSKLKKQNKKLFIELANLIDDYYAKESNTEEELYYIILRLEKQNNLLNILDNLLEEKYIRIDEPDKEIYFNTDLEALILISKDNQSIKLDNFKFLSLEEKDIEYFCDEMINKNFTLFKRKIEIPVYEMNSKHINNNLLLFIYNKFILDGLTSNVEKSYLQLLDLFNKGVIIENDNQNLNLDKLKQLLLEGYEYTNCNNKHLSIKNINIKSEQKENNKNKEFNLNALQAMYLNCENIRADIEPYDEKILSDPNRGHWDLWENIDDTGEKQKLETPIIARNPILDIKEDGVIGIDFGTKSTVVVFQENKENTMPLRVGMGNYKKDISKEQYENPTVMQFINLEKFIDDYNQKLGRPNTKWEDLTISHTARNSLINSSSDKYYSFLSDLKQWAGDSKRQLRIIDQNSFDITLKPYTELNDDDFDPIEIYAYYLGLYINNMRNGIYLDYLLSFPVTYEMTTREKIIESFKRGIKKSLPETILQNDEIMGDFSVEAGASEPAAYAICALTEYGFDPEEGEGVFYGVFDFGGGTTDFDFGLFRSSEGREQRRFDYVIEHFGASGDKYLGGENLLELLAFEVFKENESTMRNEQITFTMPVECERFPGSEILISDSQEAKLNTKQLVEKLRPLWENTKEKEELTSGIISINLFDKTGKQKPGIELLVDIQELTNILKQRIESGVSNFFNALKLSFKSDIENVKNVRIFLAGNSSKSNIVKELFEKYIQDENKSISEDLKSEAKEFFQIYPPLGSDEACTIQEKLGLKIDENDLKRPTGKTGVAFGLVKGRKGGNIKVIDKNIVDNEINFKYYLGHNKKGKFKMEIDREVGLGKWVEFIDAYEDRFEIYYTSQPKATDNNMNIKEAMRKKCKISATSEDEDVNVFIRFVSPSKIEYVVANRNDINEGNYLSDIVVEELE